MYKSQLVGTGIFFGLQIAAFIFRNVDGGTPSNILFYLAIVPALITVSITRRFLKKEKERRAFAK